VTDQKACGPKLRRNFRRGGRTPERAVVDPPLDGDLSPPPFRFLHAALVVSFRGGAVFAVVVEGVP